MTTSLFYRTLSVRNNVNVRNNVQAEGQYVIITYLAQLNTGTSLVHFVDTSVDYKVGVA